MNKIISIVSVSAWLVASIACGSSNASDSDDTTDSGSGSGGGGPGGVTPPDRAMDFLYPKAAYSGFDGTNTYKVPVATNLTGVTWTIADPTIADIAAVTAPTDAEWARFGGTWAMVTTKKDGTTTITATAGDKTLTATLVVTAYTTANFVVGDTRYNTDDTTAAQRTSCASCHKLANGADHSPMVIEWYKDDEILSAITTGAYPTTAGGYVLRGVNHAWTLTDAEKLGIVPYLRALPPNGF